MALATSHSHLDSLHILPVPDPGLPPSPPKNRKASNGEHERPQGEVRKEMQRKAAWDAGGV